MSKINAEPTPAVISEESVDEDVIPAIDSEETASGLPRRTRSVPPTLDKRKSRLAVMPLTVLLPELGEVGRLHSYRQQFLRRLQELGGEESEDRQKEHIAEEAMLNQIVKWLSLGVRE